MTDISFTVTYYNLFLGDQDSVTGWYKKGYVTESITAVIFPRGSMHRLSGLGFYSRHDAIAFTPYNVKHGCVIKTTLGTHYLIVGSPQPVMAGDQFAYYRLDLQELTDFPFSAGFFGFEDEAHYAGSEDNPFGYFEDGFERGNWAL
jgi:hypothetical protein